MTTSTGSRVKSELINARETTIRNHWEVVNISDVADKKKGSKPDNLYDEPKDGYVPYLTTGHFNSGETRWANPDSGRNPDDNEILISWDGTAGQVFRATQGVIGSTLAGIQFDPELMNPVFGYYYLLYSKDRIESLAEGTGVPHVPRDFMKIFEMPRPPIEEQNRIVEILEKVDEYMGCGEDHIEVLDTIERGILEGLFNNIGNVNKGKKIRLESNIAWIPENWKIAKLSDVTTKITDGPHSTPNYTDEGIPFVSAGDIEYGEIDFENAKLISKDADEDLRPKVDPEKGDVLLGKVGQGSIGEVALVRDTQRFNIYVQLALLRPKTDLILPQYLASSLRHYLLQRQIWDNTSGASMPYIGTNTIGKLEIPLPPIEQQQKLSNTLGTIREKISLERERVEQCRDIKAGLMQDLLTGKVSVNTD